MHNLKQINSYNRISILDGFRAIAILSVVLYHYFSRWNDPNYPYFGGDFFHQGSRGVCFFFMISGFVICYSLENTSTLKIFWKKRFIRLFPSMFIASIITFVFLILFDYNLIFPKSHNFRNLVTSITFLPPNLFDFIFGTKNHFSYLNFSYWTLWPEIQFYFLSSLIYFSDKLNFKRNFIFAFFVLLLLYYGIEFYNINQIKYVEKVINLLNLIKYLPYFASGAIFYIIYKNRFQSHLYILLIFGLFCFMNIEFIKTVFIFNMIVYGLFFCFIYYPKALSILEHRIFIKIGMSSYFLYLIHEYIGVVWIRNIVDFFYPYSFIAPILIMIVIIISSIIYTQKIESNIGKFLNKGLLKRENV